MKLRLLFFMNDQVKRKKYFILFVFSIFKRCKKLVLTERNKEDMAKKELNQINENISLKMERKSRGFLS